MKKIFFSLLSLSLISVPAITFAWGDFVTDYIGTKDYEKPTGVNILTINQNITVFKDSGTPEACPSNPNYSGRSPVAMPKYGNICYKGCVDRSQSYSIYDDEGNVTGSYTIYSRSGCVPMQAGYNVVLDGKLFAPGWGPGFDKNAQCNPASESAPNMGLIVTLSNTKQYKWDPVEPICVRAGYGDASGNRVGSVLAPTGYIEDLTGLLDTIKTTAKDDTLKYLDNGEVYDGIWTNRDIEATGYCYDGDSGCENNDPMLSGPLNHLQASFHPDEAPFYDVVHNSSASDVACDTTVRVDDPKSIKRDCVMTIKSSLIDQRIAEKKYTNADDLAELASIKQKIFSLQGQSFVDAIIKLREIANRMTDNTDKHYLYTIEKCTYTVQYDTDDVHGPYIDKILPVTSIVGSGQTYPGHEEIGSENPQVLLDDENNLVSTGVYYAGKQTFTINLQDNMTSRWDGSQTRVPGGPSVTEMGNIDNPNWDNIQKNWSGASGIGEYMIELDRITDELGETLPLEGETGLSTAENIIYVTGATDLSITGETPRTGLPFINVQITLDDTQIGKAGLYRFMVYTKDVAENQTTQYGYFYVKATPLGGHQEYEIVINHQVTNIVDENNRSGDGSAGLTNPGGKTDGDDDGGLTKPGGLLADRGNNIADGIVRTLGYDFRDQYKNPFLPDPVLGRTIDLKLTLENSLFLNQFDRTGGSSVDIGIMKNDTGELEWKTLDIGKMSTVEFTNIKPDIDGRYVFHFKVYTPTASGYTTADGQTSDILAILRLLRIDAHVEDANPPLGVQPVPFTYDTGKDQLIPLYFRPLYVSAFSGDLTLGGFIEGGVQDSSIRITKNGERPDADMTNHQFQVTFSGSKSQDFSLFGNTTDTTATTPEITASRKEITAPVHTFPNALPHFYTRLIQKSVSVAPISEIYLSTHFQYQLDGKNVVYNGNIIGKDSYFGTEDDMGYQNQINIIGNVAGSTASNIVSTEYTSIIGSGSFAAVSNSIRRAVASNIRNLPVGKDVVTGILYLTGQNLAISNHTDYQYISSPKTLVLYGGDLYIDRNMSYTNSGAILGIIVMSDGYGSGGNIYIHPSVTNIVGTLYADKAVLSGSGKTWATTYDSHISIDLLRNQLYLYGNIISQNTIGGARANPLACPRFVTATACDASTAQKYDFDYVRRYSLIDAGTVGGQTGTMIPYKYNDAENPTRIIGGGTCDITGTCSGFRAGLIQKFTNTNDTTASSYTKYPFVIEYNPQIITSPPPVFSDINEL